MDRLLQLIYQEPQKLILSKKDSMLVNKWYKDSIEKFESLDDLIQDAKNQTFWDILGQVKSALAEIENQYKRGKGLQGGVITECIFAMTLANILDLENVKNCKEYPSDCGGNNEMNSRYIYASEESDIKILQLGSPVDVDLKLFYENKEINLEIKENPAKLGEFDVTGKYDESGNLKIDNKFKSKHPYAVKMLQEFIDSEGNIFNWIGKNFKNFSVENILEAGLGHSFDRKIDFIVTVSKDGYLVFVPINKAREVFDFSNSELRIAGRNPSKVFAPDFLSKVLKSKNAIIENEIIEMNINDFQTPDGRGLNSNTRLKINEVFFVRKKDCNIKENTVKFDFKNIYQLVPTISAHIKNDKNFNEIKEIVLGP